MIYALFSVEQGGRGNDTHIVMMANEGVMINEWKGMMDG